VILKTPNQLLGKHYLDANQGYQVLQNGHETRYEQEYNNPNKFVCLHIICYLKNTLSIIINLTVEYI